MPLLSNRLVRCASAIGSPFPGILQDQRTNQTPETVRRNSTRFEFGFFTPQGELYDLSNVQSINLKLQPSQTTSGTLADQTIAAEDLDLTLDAETWADGTRAHAAFDFSNAEMNLDPQGARRTLWLVVTAIMVSGKEVTLAAGNFFIHEDNNGAADPAPENPGTPITLEQADARYELAGALGLPGVIGNNPLGDGMTASTDVFDPPTQPVFGNTVGAFFNPSGQANVAAELLNPNASVDLYGNSQFASVESDLMGGSSGAGFDFGNAGTVTIINASSGGLDLSGYAIRNVDILQVNNGAEFAGGAIQLFNDGHASFLCANYDAVFGSSGSASGVAGISLDWIGVYAESIAGRAFSGKSILGNLLVLENGDGTMMTVANDGSLTSEGAISSPYFGAEQVFTQQLIATQSIDLPSYTLATLPTPNLGQAIFISDLEETEGGETFTGIACFASYSTTLAIPVWVSQLTGTYINPA